jgi:hypothetical protein
MDLMDWIAEQTADLPTRGIAELAARLAGRLDTSERSLRWKLCGEHSEDVTIGELMAAANRHGGTLRIELDPPTA